MNLFELEDQIEQMYNDAIDPETGEVNMLKIVTYDKMQERFSDIVLGLAKKTKNIEAEAEALKKFKGEIAERQKRLENRSIRLKEYIQGAMDYSTKKLVRDEFITCKFAKNPDSVLIVDEAKIPDDYMKIEKTPKKEAIMKALKRDEEIPGASIKAGKLSLRISITNTGGQK